MAQKSNRFDTRSAEEFGELHYLAGEFSSPFNTDGFIQELMQGLSQYGFDSDHDYIALTGQTIPVALLVGVIMSCYPTARLLLFDARDGGYKDKIVTRPEVSRA